jgi:hypothetical protein
MKELEKEVRFENGKINRELYKRDIELIAIVTALENEDYTQEERELEVEGLREYFANVSEEELDELVESVCSGYEQMWREELS